jgi:hypothetical protein
MTDIAQTNDHYPEGVYLLAVTDPVLGGVDGPDNKAPIALANRTHYQRMRNVTPWRPGAGNEYPAHAYVQHGGTTWKSKVANADIEPGTDPTKWIRWGYTADELLAYLNDYIISGVLNQYALDTDLAAYLLKNEFDTYVFNKGIRFSAAVCPNGGPSMAPMNIAAPTLALPYNVYKSALGEVWMYLDNTWRVVANRYKLADIAYTTANGNQTVTIFTYTAHRAGTISAHFYTSALGGGGGSYLQCAIYKNGGPTRYMTNARVSVVEGMDVTTSAIHAVAENDVLTFIATGSNCGQISAMHSLSYID